MKYFLISIVVVSLLLADQGGSLVSSVEKITQTNSVTTQSLQSTEIAQPELQGHSPFAIAITNNGEYAYLGFDLAEVVFKVRLKDICLKWG
ncbi:MAG: hypothetical protein H6633_05370 [Anaerolineales bacterium]|nr:hypothetical protein [Anaerolineales bacterium]